MQFSPQENRKLWNDGTYSFKILESVTFGSKIHYTEDTTSQKTGNPMLKLVLEVYNSHGKSIIVLNYITDTMVKKLYNLAHSIGRPDLFVGGELKANDLINKTGKLLLTTDKDKSGQFPDKNSVKDYIAAAPASTKLDDEIPF